MKVDLDGEHWRTVPMEVVAAAGLHVGLKLDRQRLRVIRRELRSREAFAKAGRLLSRRDLSRQTLAAELEDRGVAPASREETVARLVAAGAVDDERLAKQRAEELATRGSGDALIHADLIRKGVDDELAARAVARLDSELERAHAVIESRGAGPATARYLARKGFGEDSVEAALAGHVAEEEHRA